MWQQRWVSGVAIAVAILIACGAAAEETGPAPVAGLEAAKGLYREGHFGEAIVRLQAVLDDIPQLRDLAVRQIALADAYLHLALSHLALDQREAAREALRGMLRADPERTLSPEVFAPKVLALYEEVRAEPPAPQSAAPAPAPARKRRARTPLLLGAGAAVAGGAVALAARGGDGTTGGIPDALPGSGSARIEWLGATPAPGSSISLQLGACPRGLTARCSTRLNMVFSVTSETDVSNALLVVQFLNGSIPCLEGFSIDTGLSARSLRAGVAGQMILNPLIETRNCTLPFDTTSVTAFLRTGGTQLASRTFGAGYRFTP